MMSLSLLSQDALLSLSRFCGTCLMALPYTLISACYHVCATLHQLETSGAMWVGKVMASLPNAHMIFAEF